MPETLDGIVTDVSPEQPENALAAIVVPCEITALRMELYAAGKTVESRKRPETTTVSIDETPLNALSPISVTLFGIVTDFSPEQPENAEVPMFVTLLGIVTDVSPEQP